MADGYLNFDTNVNTKGFNQGIGAVGKAADGLKSTMLKLGAAIGVAFSVKAISDFAKESKSLWETQLEAETRLDQVLKNTTGATKKQIQAVKDYASELQEVGVIGDEVQLSGLQELGTYIENADSLKKMNVVLNDMLAQQYGLNATAESAVTISTMLGKVLEGQTSALSRYGYSFDEAQEKLLKYGTEEQRVATLAEVVEQSVGGINEALAQTDAGRMKQLDNTMGDVKEQFGAAVTQIEVLFLPALKKLAAALAKVADFARSVSQALSEVFGTSGKSVTNSTGALADNAETAADNYEDMATAAKKAQKANEKSLMSFDKINKLNDNKSSDDGSDSSKTTAVPNTLGGTTTFKVNADTEGAEKQFTEFFKRIKKGFGSLLDPFKKAWANKGKAVLDSMHYKWQSIGELVKAVGESFKTVWTNGTGQKIIEHLLDIWTNINTTIGNIARQLKKAWTADNLGTEIVQHAADIFVTILKHINRITKKISDWAGGLDFKPLLKSFDTLLKALEPFADTVGEGLEWFFDNVLLPLGKWTIEKVIPTFLSTLADVIKGVTAVLKTAMPVLKDKFWDGFLKPIAKWAGDKALKALSGLGSVIKKIGKSITKEQVSVLATLAEVIGTIVLACKGKKFIDGFVNSLSGLRTQADQKLSGAFKGWDKSITATAEEGGTSFATKFAASAGAFFVGWEIGTYLHEAMGGEEFDEKYLYPIFDKIVGLKNRWIKTFENLGAKLADIAFNCTAKIKGLVKSWTKFFEGVGGKIYNVVSGAVTRAKNVVNSWNKFFGNIGSKAYDIVSSCVAKIKNTVNSWYKFFAGIGGKVYDVVSNAAKKIKNVVTSWTKFFEGIGSKICDIMSDSVSGIKKAWSGVKGFFSGIWGGIKGVFSSVGSWFKNIFSKAWGGIKSVFSSVGSFFSGLWEKIKKPFAKVADWFKDKFSKAWQAVKDVFSKGGKVFSGIKDGILNGLKTVINGLIKGINKVVSIPFKGLNKAFEKLKGVKILNKKPFDFLPEIDIPQIPQLATGTVVPANYGEFMAILGDNKREAEVVSPLSTIKQAVMEAAVELGLIGGKQNGGNMTVNLVCDGKTLASVVIDDINDRTKRNGRSPLNA